MGNQNTTNRQDLIGNGALCYPHWVLLSIPTLCLCQTLTVLLGWLTKLDNYLFCFLLHSHVFSLCDLLPCTIINWIFLKASLCKFPYMTIVLVAFQLMGIVVKKKKKGGGAVGCLLWGLQIAVFQVAAGQIFWTGKSSIKMRRVLHIKHIVCCYFSPRNRGVIKS
jgi:hypothetical protein